LTNKLGTSEIGEYLVPYLVYGRSTSRDDIMPKQSANLAELELSGWDEIRKALEEVEELRKQGFDARVEVEDSGNSSGLRVTLRSFKELREYISYRFSKMLMTGISSAIPLDDFERLVSETTTNLLEDSDTVRGRFLEC